MATVHYGKENMMDRGERLRLLALRKTFNGTEAEKAVTELLYAEPATYTAVIRVRIADPLMELDDLARQGSSMVNNFITGEVLAELSPEWFSKKWGASWWLSEQTEGIEGSTGGAWKPIDAVQLVDAHLDTQGSVNAKLTFANIEEALRWAVSYIDANQDEIKELLDDETG